MMFQSTPVIANGRIPRSGPKTKPPLSFNPRPLLLTGESPIFRIPMPPARHVSIHARYC